MRVMLGVFVCLFRWIFWLDSSRGTIERVGVNGQVREVIRENLAPSCAQVLTLDFSSFTIFWANRCDQTIDSVRMDGSRISSTVTIGTGLSSTGLSIFDGFLYWANSVSGSLIRANRTTGQPLEEVSFLSRIFLGGVEIVHPEKQLEGECIVIG